MALFSKTENQKPEQVVAHTPATLAHILRNPRITEKATMHELKGVYLFDVAESATKRDIIAAVRAIYKVSPRKVTVARVPSKSVRNRRTGKVSGTSGGGKKAYVYLKQGETITVA